jgi:hypothetical protein
MEILYEIIEFNPTTGSILIRYYDTSNTQNLYYNIDLPLTDGQLPNETEVRQHIEFMKPTGQMERRNILKDVEVPTFLQSFIPTEQYSNNTTIITGVDTL